LRTLAQRAYEPAVLPISISIAPTRRDHGLGISARRSRDEMGIAGGIRGAPVQLTQWRDDRHAVHRRREIVLEAENLPTG